MEALLIALVKTRHQKKIIKDKNTGKSGTAVAMGGHKHAFECVPF